MEENTRASQIKNKTKVYNLLRDEGETEYWVIAGTLGISLNEVQVICEELEKEGLIEHEDSWLYDYIWEQIRADKNG